MAGHTRHWFFIAVFNKPRAAAGVERFHRLARMSPVPYVYNEF